MFKTTVLSLYVALLLVLLQSFNLTAADNKTVYERDGKCASCHGTDGKGKQKIADLFKIDVAKLNLVDEETGKKSDAQLAKTTRDGVDKSKMKGYKDQFSDEEIAELVKYIRFLKK